jgi:hypothetical protein
MTECPTIIDTEILNVEMTEHRKYTMWKRRWTMHIEKAYIRTIPTLKRTEPILELTLQGQMSK